MVLTPPKIIIPECWEISRPFLLYRHLEGMGGGDNFYHQQIPEMKQ